MSKNMFFIKEEDQELFDQFSPIFIDYGKNSIQYRERTDYYEDTYWYKFSVVFFVLFTRTRGDYYKNILKIIIDIYDGKSKNDIKEKYKASDYIINQIIYRGPDKLGSNTFFAALDGFLISIYQSYGNLPNINIAKWEFPYLYYRHAVDFTKNDKNRYCSIGNFIRGKDINPYGVKPILMKVARESLSYFLEYDKTEDMSVIETLLEEINPFNDIVEEPGFGFGEIVNFPTKEEINNASLQYMMDHDSRLTKLNYVRQECTSAKLTISYLESQIKKEKKKLNKLELELANIKKGE